MLSVNYAGCRKQAHYAECCYAECHYAERRGAHIFTFELEVRRGSLQCNPTTIGYRKYWTWLKILVKNIYDAKKFYNRCLCHSSQGDFSVRKRCHDTQPDDTLPNDTRPLVGFLLRVDMLNVVMLNAIALSVFYA